MPERLFITGGASGFGRALALNWAKDGAQVAIGDINAERGRVVADEIDAAGGRGLYLDCDVRCTDALTAAAARLDADWGGIDVLVNNAGVATAGSLAAESVEQWQWMLDINLLGVVRGCQAFLPVFERLGRGTIVNVASQAGLTPIPRMGSYNSAKAAVVAFSETLSLELADRNVRVSVVCPSFFATNLGESLRTDEADMRRMLERMFDKADMTADEVAAYTVREIRRGRFLVMPHAVGRRAFMTKRLLPVRRYLALVRRETARIMQSAGRSSGNDA